MTFLRTARGWTLRPTTTPSMGREYLFFTGRSSCPAVHKNTVFPRANIPFSTRLLKTAWVRRRWPNSSLFSRSKELYLRKLFPAFSPSAPKDFSSSLGPCPGKKAVLGSSFSLGRLVSSFHPVRSPIKLARRFSGFSRRRCLKNVSWHRNPRYEV